MSDVLLRNCEIVNADSQFFGSILMSDGKIQAIVGPRDQPQAATVIDVGGRPVIPGVIDTHVHLGVGPKSFAEDCLAESRSAAVTGVTTFMNYLLQMESYKPLIPQIEQDIAANSMVDMWLHAAIMSDEHLGEMVDYVEEFDISSFKFFMAYKGSEAMDFLRGVDDGLLYEALNTLAKYPHVLPMVHAENIELVLRGIDKVRATGRQDLAAWAEARPAIAEEEAQLRAWFLARNAGSKLLVVHMSAGYTAAQLAEQRVNYPFLYGETCPQFLGLDDTMPLGGLGKCNPPVRDRRNAELLWQALENGSIDFVGSDHSTFSREQKANGLWEASPGLPSMPAILPVLLSEGVNRGRLTLQQLVRVTSYNAARIFGMLPRKGRIQVGADADLTVLDLTKTQRFTLEAVASGLDWSPYEGLTFTGWPVMTFLGGRLAASEGAIVDDAIRGQRLRASALSAPRP